MRGGEWLKALVDDWFNTDFDIEFALMGRPDAETIADAIHGLRGRGLICTFESDAWYDHTRGSVRHGGDRRRFVVVEGDDALYEEVKEFCDAEYDKEDLIGLIEVLEERYEICDTEEINILEEDAVYTIA